MPPPFIGPRLDRHLFYKTLTPRERVLLVVAIFALFAPIGVLVTLMFDGVRFPAIVVAIYAVQSGGSAVLWALSFIKSFRFLFGAISMSIIGGPMLDRITRRWCDWDKGASFDLDRALSAGLCVVLVVGGYILLVRLMAVQGDRTRRLKAELDLAQAIHGTLVPPIDVRSPLARVMGRSRASSEMGGDLIDAVDARTHVDVILGDVSGHGVKAGVVMAMLKSAVRMRMLRERGADADLAGMVADLNRVLSDLIEPGMFATFVAMRLTARAVAGAQVVPSNGPGLPGTGATRLDYALAGHLPIYHYRAAAAEWTQHPNAHLPLAVDADEPFTAGSTGVEAGDLLVVFTDGFTEVQNRAGREFTDQGVEAILRSSGPRGPEAVMKALFEGCDAHGPQLDDQSVVVVQVA